VRLTHPLNSHLAHATALRRKACEPIASWLAESFGCASGLAGMHAYYAQPLPNVTLALSLPAGRLSRARPASQHCGGTCRGDGLVRRSGLCRPSTRADKLKSEKAEFPPILWSLGLGVGCLCGGGVGGLCQYHDLGVFPL
jgi:hypothetical protein